MATPDNIDLAEAEVARLVDVAHKQGLNYWEIQGIFIKACANLYIQASCEYHIKGGN